MCKTATRNTHPSKQAKVEHASTPSMRQHPTLLRPHTLATVPGNCKKIPDPNAQGHMRLACRVKHSASRVATEWGTTIKLVHLWVPAS